MPIIFFPGERGRERELRYCWRSLRRYLLDGAVTRNKTNSEDKNRRGKIRIEATERGLGSARGYDILCNPVVFQSGN